MRNRLLILFTLFICNSSFGQEKSIWAIEAHAGFPINLPTPLTITQNGYEDIKLTANYYSQPFVPPIFWVYRISKWKNNKAWELEMMHQKLYLENNPPEVQDFSITHGYNLLMANRAVKTQLLNKEFVYRLGAGIVIAHAEGIVRNKPMPQHSSFLKTSYYLAGPVINLALAKQFKISNRFHFNLESKFNGSYAIVPIADGKAYVWHAAFEFIGGLGVNLNK